MALVLKIVDKKEKVERAWQFTFEKMAPSRRWSDLSDLAVAVIFNTSPDTRRVSFLRSSICCTIHSSCCEEYHKFDVRKVKFSLYLFCCPLVKVLINLPKFSYLTC